ncbi:hypothetical protein ACHAW6_006331 [Cyclotella cf. meneghiniana]
MAIMFGNSFNHAHKIVAEVVENWLTHPLFNPIDGITYCSDDNRMREVSNEFHVSSQGVMSGCIGALDGWVVKVKQLSLCDGLKDPASFYSRKEENSHEVLNIIPQHSSIQAYTNNYDFSTHLHASQWNAHLVGNIVAPTSIYSEEKHQDHRLLPCFMMNAKRIFHDNPSGEGVQGGELDNRLDENGNVHRGGRPPRIELESAEFGKSWRDKHRAEILRQRHISCAATGFVNVTV